MSAHDFDLMRRIDEIPSVSELESNHVVRQALEAAAKAVERLNGGRHYQAAFKRAARMIRSMKPD